MRYPAKAIQAPGSIYPRLWCDPMGYGCRPGSIPNRGLMIRRWALGRSAGQGRYPGRDRGNPCFGDLLGFRAIARWL